MTDSETKVKTGLLALVLATGPAEAWTCPHGQLLRVHMGKCVSMESALAADDDGRDAGIEKLKEQLRAH